MPKSDKVASQELYTRRNECAGFKFINMQNERTFTYNIFELNAHELFNVAEIICDPDGGIYLLSTENREAGTQAHREINRRMHNFVASAKTLVDHTRVFITTKYRGTSIFDDYRNKISKEISNYPVVSFVHDIRNYMLHKGLPPSKMFFEAKPADDGNGYEFNTGVYYDSDDLLSWKKWSTGSVKYIKSHNEKIHIKDFCVEYLNIISGFHLYG